MRRLKNRQILIASIWTMDICYKEVSDAIDRTKFGKAYLDVPNEALKNENATKLLHKLFSLCFSNGISPLDWSFSDIKPIPKKDKDPRDPLNNRCITIMCCIEQHSRNEVALGFKKVKK